MGGWFYNCLEPLKVDMIKNVRMHEVWILIIIATSFISILSTYFETVIYNQNLIHNLHTLSFKSDTNRPQTSLCRLILQKRVISSGCSQRKVRLPNLQVCCSQEWLKLWFRVGQCSKVSKSNSQIIFQRTHSLVTMVLAILILNPGYWDSKLDKITATFIKPILDSLSF